MAERAYVYEQVAERIEGMIRNGTLTPGDKAPSLRNMSQTLGVSITSVTKAYTILEDQGWIEAWPQSGFYVRGMDRQTEEPEPSASDLDQKPVAKNQFITTFLGNIKDPGNRWFGCATPELSLLPVKTLSKMVADAAREDESNLDYFFAPGFDDLRRTIARKIQENGCSVSPRDVVITNGCLDALNLSLSAVAGPGDAIAIESPTYFGVLQAIENHGMRAVEIATHPRTGVDPDALETAFKQCNIKACLFIPNFNNPLGSLMPESHKEHLAHLLARYRVPMIEDNVYGDLYFCNQRPKTVKAYDKAGMVILCSSFSKTLAPGLRIGYAISEPYAEILSNKQFMSTVAAPGISQRVVNRFLESHGYERHLRRLRSTFQGSIARFKEVICRTFPKGTRVTCPKGGFSLWLALPHSIDVLELYRRATAEGISFAPGHLFSAGTSFQNYIRISCGIPWTAKVEQTLERLGSLALEAAGGR